MPSFLPDSVRFEAPRNDDVTLLSASRGGAQPADDWLADAESVLRDIDGSAVRSLAAACRRRAGKSPGE